MAESLQTNRPMTFREFKRFYDAQPEGERWELIYGVPVLSPSPNDLHNVIVFNICLFLHGEARRLDLNWMAIPGVGLKIPTDPPSAPRPDVLVRPYPPLGKSFIEDALASFEVLSPGCLKRDLEVKPPLYAALPSLEHYLVVSQRTAMVTAFDRAAGWRPREVTGIDEVVELPALGVALPVREIYRRAGLE